MHRWLVLPSGSFRYLPFCEGGLARAPPALAATLLFLADITNMALLRSCQAKRAELRRAEVRAEVAPSTLPPSNGTGDSRESYIAPRQ
jgi:hypothetical protein